MEISRRKFFFFGLAAGVGLFLPDKKIVIGELFKPTAKQIEFLYGSELSLYGIPYHANYGTVGTWLGYPRVKSFVDNIKIPDGY